MKRGRILVMSQFFHPEYVTSSVLVTQMAEDLAAAGFQVEALTGMPKEYTHGQVRAARKERRNGVLIRRVGYLQLSRKSRIGRLLNYFSLVASMAMRWPWLLKYDCIVVYSLPPLLPLLPALLHRFFRRRFVFVCYDLYPDLAVAMQALKPGSAVDRVMLFTNRTVYRRAAAVVAIGGEMKRYMLQSGLVTDAEKIRVAPNWYDGEADPYRPAAQKKEGEAFTVVYSGNMGVCQDMDTILRAAALLNDRQDVRFVFTGHGNKAGRLKQEAERLGLANVEFRGFLMGNDYADMLAGADCFVVSLECGMEGLAVPSKTYSYLAAGRPVLAIIGIETDIARDLAEYDCGFTVAGGDAAALAGRILSLAEDRSAAVRMGCNARRLYEGRYRRELCTKRYVELLEEILSSK